MAVSTLQTALRLVYPPRCLTCSATVDSDFGLCGPCWRDTQFIGSTICDACGVPLLGDDPGAMAHCDECMTVARPWAHGRSAVLYKDNGRKLVLGLKHGDRHDVVRPAALWMAAAVRDILQPHMLIAPVPLHWTRLLKRRYNQSTLLAQALAKQVDLECCPDLLIRPQRTVSLDGLGRDARFTALKDAIRPHPRRKHKMAGRPVLLVDDVMTSGATLAAATEACHLAGASHVCVVTLARVAKDT
ncbi:MAG: putative amidophosphoribosyltransferase [Ascidiaceihabitans sp.]|jgi:predicted amidophosphoribosyltransferase